MKPAVLTLAIVALTCVVADAKLPPPSDEAKAKAAEAAAKTKWTDSVAAYQLCKAQDRVAAAYFVEAKKAGKPASPPASAPPACVDPGPFAYVPATPENKPIESSGAHSPAALATSPPSTNQPAAAASGPKK
jgi:cytoskeletal protein RodZ